MQLNFIYIVTDDLGCYGADAEVSPNLDRLAREGLRFTRAYSNSPVCSPARFAMITGRWQYRLRGALDEPLGRRGGALGLPPEHPTLPSLLHAAGYNTALIGKWHLGAPRTSARCEAAMSSTLLRSAVRSITSRTWGPMGCTISGTAAAKSMCTAT